MMKFTHHSSSLNIPKCDGIKHCVMKMDDEMIKGICEMFKVWYIWLSPSNILTIMLGTWGKGLTFTWCMDIKQSTCFFGHHRTLCDQQWRTWYIHHIVSWLGQVFTPPHRRASDRLLRTYQQAFRGEHGWGHLGNNGAIWSCWKGVFPGITPSAH